MRGAVVGVVEVPAAVVDGDGLDEAETGPFVDGGAADAEPVGEDTAGDELLIAVGGGDLPCAFRTAFIDLPYAATCCSVH